ncbi:hypothetical protein BCR34DRAFT_666699 [Clohesyomyces aquaticus]|uniref:Uncharacterized protein n=1 Tax=Clohesyomyces aquaticus TaxID=1231657 RepID=A0A1Y1Z7B3_9PLEO|nr:hypothetical protein BCR34DRAFT_666699 [Clohesyomyces aquaticus]
MGDGRRGGASRQGCRDLTCEGCEWEPLQAGSGAPSSILGIRGSRGHRPRAARVLLAEPSACWRRSSPIALHSCPAPDKERAGSREQDAGAAALIRETKLLGRAVSGHRAQSRRCACQRAEASREVRGCRERMWVGGRRGRDEEGRRPETHVKRQGGKRASPRANPLAIAILNPRLASQFDRDPTSVSCARLEDAHRGGLRAELPVRPEQAGHFGMDEATPQKPNMAFLGLTAPSRNRSRQLRLDSTNHSVAARCPLHRGCGQVLTASSWPQTAELTDSFVPSGLVLPNQILLHIRHCICLIQSPQLDQRIERAKPVWMRLCVPHCFACNNGRHKNGSTVRTSVSPLPVPVLPSRHTFVNRLSLLEHESSRIERFRQRCL